MSKGLLLNGAGQVAAKAPHPSALETPDTCGSCHWCKPGDAKNGCCFGGPPTPVLAGATQDALGRAVPQIMSMRAMVPYDAPSCAVYKKRSSLIIGQAQGEA